jgi:hypothetical protein
MNGSACGIIEKVNQKVTVVTQILLQTTTKPITN